MGTLVFEEVGTARKHVVDVRRVLIAGFTGRDQHLVTHHIEELARMGVPVPESVPTIYRLGPDMVRQSSVLVTGGSNTSGEVEPVVVVSGDALLLTVGSDHTDRDLEREDIAISKEACQKMVATSCVPLSEVREWDAIELHSNIHDGPYQQGALSDLLPLDDLLGHLVSNEGVTLEEGDVLFLGTVPVQGRIRPSPLFSGEMWLPEMDASISFSYRVLEVSSTGRRPLAKAELEFSDVDGVEWTPIEGVPGQAERILARDPGSGLATRMLRFEPGTDTTKLGVLRHDFWEEVYILSGELHDLTLDRVFPASSYACRPPGMPHGPWRSEPGCITFEVRYPAI